MVRHDIDPTPEEARAALASASSTRIAADRDAHVLRRVLVGVGAAWGLLMPLFKLTGDDGRGFWAGMILYFVVIAGLVLWQRRVVRVVPRGYARWYSGGIAAAAVMYGVGLFVGDPSTPWPTVWLLAALVLAPTVFCASHIGAHR